MDERDAEQQTRVAGSTFVAAQRGDPARWVKVLEIAKRTKTSPDFVDKNLDVLQQS